MAVYKSFGFHGNSLLAFIVIVYHMIELAVFTCDISAHWSCRYCPLPLTGICDGRS